MGTREQVVLTALTTTFTPLSTTTLVGGGLLAATEGRRIQKQGKKGLELFRRSVVGNVLSRHPQTRPMTPSEIGEWWSFLSKGFNAINEPAMDAFVSRAAWTQPQPVTGGVRAPGQRATPQKRISLQRAARSGPVARFDPSSGSLGPIAPADPDYPLLLDRLGGE